jgi:hypothetical protein
MSSTILHILFITIAFVGVSVPVVAIMAVRQIKKQAHENDHRLQEVTYELSQIRTSFVEPIKRLYEIEQRSRRLTERLEQLEMRDKSQRQFDQAVKVIQRGGSVDEIMNTCGLNRGEAQLVKTMHEAELENNAIKKKFA